ncbi:hypothetical protein AX17_002338 [Amanita inopinata Kibby_2008]|nr:hypothetical protein AX17_002338 [Amanita inopinata Kibby_2008]
MADSIPSAPGPSQPLRESYTYHSPKPTAPGPYILGVDEAGRGPVLGPLVYGVAYCPAAYAEQLEQLGFADSKTLTPESRASLLQTLSSDPSNIGWSVRVVSPQAISSGMLRRPPVNLNRQSQDATIHLIHQVITSGIQISEVYVDALGNTTTYEAYLSSLFPGINFTVTAKADAQFKIVGAASVAAKVTRDACIEGWSFEESETETEATWSKELGSGYPSDPKTQAWLKNNLEPTFGYPKLVRFSWTTVKLILDKHAHPVKWTDEGQESLVKAFDRDQGRDKDRYTWPLTTAMARQQTRPIQIAFDGLARVDGSARFAFGKTAALASVSGPIEARLSAENPSQATFQVHLRPLSGVPATDARSIASSIRAALTPSLVLTQNPRALVQLTLQPLSLSQLPNPGTSMGGVGSDHTLPAALINASTLALINAGSIPMRGTVVAVSVGLSASTGQLIIDPDEEQQLELTAAGCFAFLFADDDIHCVWTSWKDVAKSARPVKDGDISQARQLACAAARNIKDEMKAQLVNMGKKNQINIPPPPLKHAANVQEDNQKPMDIDDDEKMEI